jgi:hypothetical protein
MDYRKLDSGLAAAIARTTPQSADRMSVFVRTDGSLSSEAVEKLKAAGVHNPQKDAAVFTGELTYADVEQLSAEPWVKSIRLGTRSRPLGDK